MLGGEKGRVPCAHPSSSLAAHMLIVERCIYTCVSTREMLHVYLGVSTCMRCGYVYEKTSKASWKMRFRDNLIWVQIFLRAIHVFFFLIPFFTKFLKSPHIHIYLSIPLSVYQYRCSTPGTCQGCPELKDGMQIHMWKMVTVCCSSMSTA